MDTSDLSDASEEFSDKNSDSSSNSEFTTSSNSSESNESESSSSGSSEYSFNSDEEMRVISKKPNLKSNRLSLFTTSSLYSRRLINKKIVNKTVKPNSKVLEKTSMENLKIQIENQQIPETKDIEIISNNFNKDGDKQWNINIFYFYLVIIYNKIILTTLIVILFK